jgi:hypothetical protein
MRRLDEFARLWNDTRSRLPRSARSLSAWSWPLVAALGGAAIVLVGTGPSDVGTASNASDAGVPVKASTACEEQTWPYLSDACLQRNRHAGAHGAQTPSQVRVLNYEPGMARAAIGATPWAPKGAARQPQSQNQAKERKTIQDRNRTVTVRSGRDQRRERVYNVPNDAYSAYGYAPRR